MRYIVAFYEMDRSYGGPEEGGWWYDSGELVRVHRVCLTETGAVRRAARANRLLDRVQRHCRAIDSVLYAGGRFRACVFDSNAPTRFPEARPHFE